MPTKKRKPCKPTQIRNPKTGRCVLRAGKIGRKILGHAPPKRKPKAKSAKKPCRPDQIRNPASGRCVKRSGAIGRKIVKMKGKKTWDPMDTWKTFRTRCKPNQIRSPKTGRCVLRTGKIGRKIRFIPGYHAPPKR